MPPTGVSVTPVGAVGAVVSITTVVTADAANTVPALVVSMERMLCVPAASVASKVKVVVATVALPSFSPVSITPSLSASLNISTVLDAVLIPVKVKAVVLKVMLSLLLDPVSSAPAKSGAFANKSLAAKSVTLLRTIFESLVFKTPSPLTSNHSEFVDLSNTA